MPRRAPETVAPTQSQPDPRSANLQLLVVTPLQKIHVIEPFVASVGFVSNTDGERSKLRNLTIEAYRAEKARRAG